MASPVRVAIGGKGRLFVSDFLAEAVFELEAGPGGARVARAFTIPGRPLGVAWARRNRLLVGNSSTGSVDVYRATNGKYLYSLGGRGTFEEPTDIAVDLRRNLAFVLDSRAKSIKVFRLKDGAPLRTISGPGPGDYYLQSPTGVAVDEVRREVLVSDYGDPTRSDSPPAVKIYGYDGTYLQTISGKAGMLGQRFSRPQGLAVVNPAVRRWKRCQEKPLRRRKRKECEPVSGASARILVVDAVAGEVLVLDRESGDLLQTLGSFGSGPQQLWLPLDVAVDGRLNVFVTNNRPRRVEVFTLGG
jgi:DNA-binding beta-propeller fold protein YncE